MNRHDDDDLVVVLPHGRRREGMIGWTPQASIPDIPERLQAFAAGLTLPEVSDGFRRKPFPFRAFHGETFDAALSYRGRGPFPECLAVHLEQ